MSRAARIYGVVSGIAALAFCLAGGVWILTKVGFTMGDDAMWTGVGLYFVGKALFVGPMLILTAVRD